MIDIYNTGSTLRVPKWGQLRLHQEPHRRDKLGSDVLRLSRPLCRAHARTHAHAHVLQVRREHRQRGRPPSSTSPWTSDSIMQHRWALIIPDRRWHSRKCSGRRNYSYFGHEQNRFPNGQMLKMKEHYAVLQEPKICKRRTSIWFAVRYQHKYSNRVHNVVRPDLNRKSNWFKGSHMTYATSPC